MATLNFYESFNLNTEAQFYDFIDPDFTSITTTRIVHEAPFNQTQVFTGYFQTDFYGNVSTNSRIDAIDTYDAFDNLQWSASGLNLPVSVYDTYIDDDGIIGRDDSGLLLEYMLRGNDVVNGSNEVDSAVLYRGNDDFLGFAGDDYVNGHYGNDVLNGHFGDDTVRGGADNDIVRGGADDDLILGDKGNDQIRGDRGNDTLSGGEGADQFIFDFDSGVDVIVDFEAADQIVLYSRPGLYSPADIDISYENGNSVIDLTSGQNLTVLDYTVGLDDITVLV